MEIDSGPGPAPPEPSPSFVVSAFGLVSRTFSVWMRRLLSYAAISALAGIVFVGLQVAVFWAVYGLAGLVRVGSVSTDPFSVATDLLLFGGPSAFFVLDIALMLIGMVIYAVVGGGVVKLALDNYGTPGSGAAGESMRFALGRVPTLIGAQLVLGLILSALLTPALLMFAMLPADLNDPAIAPFLMVLLVVLFVSIFVIVYVAVRFAPLLAVVIAEDVSAIDAIRKAFHITSRNFWHILGGTLLLGISTVILATVLGMLVSPVSLYSPEWAYVVTAAITALFVSPLEYVFQGVLYKDLSSRATSQTQQQWW